MFGSHDNSIIQHNGKNVLLYDTKKHMNFKKIYAEKEDFTSGFQVTGRA